MQIDKFNFPDDLLYDENHFWFKAEGDVVVMGMDDFGQQLAGEIVYVQLPKEGKKAKQGKKLAKIESGKWLGKVFSPVNGELVAVNEELETNPGLINKDCYGEGWLYKVKAADLGPLDELKKDAAAMEAWIAAEMEKYKDQL